MTYTAAEIYFAAVRKQRAAYLAWQNAPAGETEALKAYEQASAELRAIEINRKPQPRVQEQIFAVTGR